MSSFKNPYFSKGYTPPKESLIRDPEEEGLVISFTEAIRECKGVIYSSARTCWWTSTPDDLIVKPGRVPQDCFGSPLFENDNFKGWFNLDAIKGHEAYGRKGRRLRNFMLAHSKNIHIACNKMPKDSFEMIKDLRTFAKFCDENEV